MKAKNWIVIVKFVDGSKSIITDIDTVGEITRVIETFEHSSIRSIKIKPSIKA